MSDPVTIRAVAPQDRQGWEALYAAYADFYGVSQTPEMRDRVWGWLHDPAHEVDGFVAEQSGTLIGLAHVRVFARPLAASKGLFLDDLFVSPDARGTGAAAAMLDAVRADAAAKGCALTRWITADDNARARGLYDKHAEATGWVTYDMATAG